MATLVSKTIKPSGGDYTSVQGAIVGIETDYPNLVISDVYIEVEISGSWSSADTTKISGMTFVTNATHYVKFFTDTANRAGAKWDADRYRYIPGGSDTYAINVTADYIWFDGMQFSCAGNSSLLYMLSTGPAGGATSLIKASNCICNGNNTGSTFIGDPTTDLPATLKVWNCIAYNFSGGYGVFYGSDDVAFVANFYNCTSYKNTNRGFRNQSGTMNCYNCGSFTSANYDFLGTIGGDYNCSSDATAPGAHSLQSKTVGDQFVSVSAGSEDFNLKAGADCIDAGSDPSAGFSDDINGVTRSGTWDIGAAEYVSEEATNVVMNVI